MYWTDRSDGTISRAGIDGQTPPQHLGDGLFGHTTNDGPLGIALDPLTETVRGYTLEKAKSEVAHISSAHNGGTSWFQNIKDLTN